MYPGGGGEKKVRKLSRVARGTQRGSREKQFSTKGGRQIFFRGERGERTSSPDSGKIRERILKSSLR